MKKLIILTSFFMAMFITSISGYTIHNRNIDVNYFYGALDPYGEWIEIAYDDYVWRPYKSDYNWRPYSDGRWEWTRHGWYWVSYEPFGWATYHYGRWYQDDYYGWVWMPDNVWAPAWVEWRYNDAYIGWAPLPPYARFNPRKGIHFSINWNSGHIYWNFVKYNHFASYNVYNYYLDRSYVYNVYKKTKYRTNYFAENDRIVNGGVNRRFVESKMGRKFTTREISRTENFNEYNSKDIKKRRGIVDYRPSESSIKSSTFDKKKVVKGKSLSSLSKDKVVINRRTGSENKNKINIQNNRNGTIKKENNNTVQKKVRTEAKNNQRIEKKNIGNAKSNLPKSTERNISAPKNNQSEKKYIKKSVEKTELKNNNVIKNENKNVAKRAEAKIKT